MLAPRCRSLRRCRLPPASHAPLPPLPQQLARCRPPTQPLGVLWHCCDGVGWPRGRRRPDSQAAKAQRRQLAAPRGPHLPRDGAAADRPHDPRAAGPLWCERVGAGGRRVLAAQARVAAAWPAPTHPRWPALPCSPHKTQTAHHTPSPAGRTPGTVDVFFREAVHRNKRDDKGLGYLLFLQGGCWGGCWGGCLGRWVGG